MDRHTATWMACTLCLALAMSGCDDGMMTPTDAGSMGTDAGPMGIDAGPMGIDAGPMGTDAGPGDAGPGDDAGPDVDAGDTDAGTTDAGTTDAGGMDAGSMDAGGSDAGGTDAGGTDAGGGDAGPAGCTIDADLASMVGDAVATGTTAGAPDESTPSCNAVFGGPAPDADFSWTAPSTGMWTFDTFGSDFDTVLHVHTGLSCADTTEVGCNDDVTTGSGLQSRVDLMLTAGDTVTLVVDGFDAGDEGAFVLSINPTPTATSEANCGNSADDDRDGDVDCADSDCVFAPSCTETAAECGNTMDDDGDGDTDCADSDCAGYAACTETACGNSTDDDGDGDVDCADSDCALRAPCDGCPDTDLGMMIGAAVGTADTTGGVNRRTGSCGGSGPETTFEFTAPTTGTYTIDTAGSAIDTTLYVLAASCLGAELACNDDDTTLSPQSSVTLDLGMGETVIIVVDGFGGAEGAITLNISNTVMSFGPPMAGDLVINEILNNVAAATEGNREWFEVYNSTTTTFNLNGCRFTDDGTDSMMVVGDTLIHPGQYFTFGGRLVTFTPDYEYAGFTLGNDDDEIILECGSPFVVIDRVAYDGGPMFPDPSDGQSMSLDPSARDATMNDTGSNWCLALPTRPYDGLQTGTPGRPNPSCP